MTDARCSCGALTLTLPGPSRLVVACHFLDYKRKNYTAKFAGTELIAGNAAYKIELNLNAGQVFTYFIDCKTNLLVRETRLSKGETTPVVVDYGNYKQHSNGCFFPMYITGRLGIVEITKIDVNPVIDVKLFKP